MARNLRKFATVADYQSAQLIKPAVSLIEATDGVFFDQKEVVPTFGGLTVKYNIEDPTVEVQLFNGGGSSTSESSSESGSGGGGGALPTRMIVDGNEETPISTWRFETAGEHIVQYEFADNAVPQEFLNSVGSAKEVIVGTDIVGIGHTAFNVKLTSATCLSTTPPSIADMSTFGGGEYGQSYPIYVPSSAVNTYKTASIWASLASRIQAIQ